MKWNMLKTSWLILVFSLMIGGSALLFPVLAQDPGTLEARVELAMKIQALLPAEEQLFNAVDRYLDRFDEQYRATYKAALLEALPPHAVQKVAIDGYAQIYTLEELQAMYNYYSSPEGKAILAKSEAYDHYVAPVIVMMLDRAMVRLRGLKGGAED